MSYKKFETGDLFFNTIKAKPRFEFKIWGGQASVNTGISLASLNDIQISPPTEILLAYTPPIVNYNTGSCSLPYSFDFSCPDNSYNIAII